MPPEQLLASGKWQVKCLCLNLSENGPADSKSFTLVEWSMSEPKAWKEPYLLETDATVLRNFFYPSSVGIF